MTDKKTAETDTENTTDLARKIWLAGVGAYGRVFSEAQGRFEKVSGAANELFDELVAKGSQVEDQVKSAISKNETATKVTEQVEKTTEQVREYRESRLSDLEERFEKVRETVMDRVAPFNVFGLGEQVDALTKRVEELEAELAKEKAKPVARTATKRAPSKPAAKVSEDA